MAARGECLACSRIAHCGETSVDRAIESYTCPFFEGADEAVYLARMELIRQYGDIVAVEVIANRRRNNQALVREEESEDA